VHAAVHVDDLAGRRGEPVGQQRRARARDRLRVGDVPAERSAVVPHALEPVEARDRLRGHGPQRPGRDQVDPHSLWAEVTGEVPRARLEAGLGHAHPVVARPGHARVEVQAHDRAAAAHQRQRGRRDRLERVRGDLHRGGYVGPPGAQEVPAECLFRVGVRDRVQHAVQAVDVCGDPLGERVEVILAGHVQLEDWRRGWQPPGDPLHQAQPAESGQHHARALLLGHPGHVEGDRGVGDDPGHQDPLARQDSHHSLTPVVSGTRPTLPARSRQLNDRRCECFLPELVRIRQI
jgi:hypothetical protein